MKSGQRFLEVERLPMAAKLIATTAEPSNRVRRRYRKLATAHLLVLALATWGCRGEESGKSTKTGREPLALDFVGLFGPQTQEAGAQIIRHPYLSRCDLRVSVLPARELTLAGGANRVLTLKDGRIQSVSSRSVIPDRSYLAVVLTPPTTRIKSIYSCRVRLDSGPLAGALVWVTMNSAPQSARDPIRAVYELPGAIRDLEGPVECSVVEWAVK